MANRHSIVERTVHDTTTVVLNETNGQMDTTVPADFRNYAPVDVNAGDKIQWIEENHEPSGETKYIIKFISDDE